MNFSTVSAAAALGSQSMFDPAEKVVGCLTHLPSNASSFSVDRSAGLKTVTSQHEINMPSATSDAPTFLSIDQQNIFPVGNFLSPSDHQETMRIPVSETLRHSRDFVTQKAMTQLVGPYEVTAQYPPSSLLYHPLPGIGTIISPITSQSLPQCTSPQVPFHSFAPRILCESSPSINLSPTVVSPMSIVSSQTSDLSPTEISWACSPSHNQYDGRSGVPYLNAVSTTGPGLTMVAGFPYPVQQPPPQTSLKIISQTKYRRVGTTNATGGKTLDHNVELVDLNDHDQDAPDVSNNGLGFIPAIKESDNRIVVPVARREEARRARIECEQRRRNELREGFERLREVLPPTNQRTSKAVLLDRAVAHIQSIESANRYLVAHFDSKARECEELRKSHTKLLEAMAQRGGDSSPKFMSLM